MEAGRKRSLEPDSLGLPTKAAKTDPLDDDAPIAQPYSGGDDQDAPIAQPYSGEPYSGDDQQAAGESDGMGLPLAGQPLEEPLGQPLQPAQHIGPVLDDLDGGPAQSIPFGNEPVAAAQPIELAAAHLAPAQPSAVSFDFTNQQYQPAQGMGDEINLTQFDSSELDDMQGMQQMQSLDSGYINVEDDDEIDADQQDQDFSADTGVTEKRRKSRMEAVDEPDTVEREIFTPYSCPKLPKDVDKVPHCGEVVETSSLAAVDPPDITHECLIPHRVIREGRLSDLQWEAVNYAGQRHTQFNKDGSRGGFMLGDGTGVGKGRTCAGVIYDYFMHQRKERAEAPDGAQKPTKPIISVWVSVSWDLAQDAVRDLSAITEPLDDQPIEEGTSVQIRTRSPGIWTQATTLRQDRDHKFWWVAVLDDEGDEEEKKVASEDIRVSVCPVVTVKEAQAASFNFDDYMVSGLVLFATYSVFSRGDASTGLVRLRELMAPPGEEYTFEGVVAFDEAHNAKNLVAGRGKASKTGLHVKKLQDDFESARIVYASATGASEVRNMGYMTRLGLWGDGTPFSDFAKIPPGKRYPAFLPELKKGGFGAMELVGMDLKAQGRYLCRTLSFKGASFDVSEAKLSAEDRKVYDDAAAIWQRLIVICKNGRFWSHIEGVNLKTFWAAQQLFFRQLLCAFKVRHTVALIHKALDEERSVIVGVQLTGDSRVQEMLKELMKGREDEALPITEDELEEDDDDEEEEEQAEELPPKGKRKSSRAKKPKPKAKGKGKGKKKRAAEGPGELEDAFSSTKETFTRLIENCWAQTENISIPAVRALRKGQPFDQVLQQPIMPGQPPAPALSDAQQRRHKIWKDLVDRADALNFPVNPIDGILMEFGPDMVAEVTGRRLRAEKRPGGRVEYVPRSQGVPQAKLNLIEQRSFVNGKKRIIIISQAGSSGISLHAGFDYSNQEPRTHIILELPWSSEQLIQQCGRSHRSNQLSAPEFLAISTDVAGETRFAMSVAARMQSLGALTKSDRRAAHCTSAALSRFNFVTATGRDALREVQSKTQVQALARLAGANKPPARAGGMPGHGGVVELQPPPGGELSENQKREHLNKLGLHESATNKEMREKFIARGIVCFVDRQMADRDMKAIMAQEGKPQRGMKKSKNMRAAEEKRGLAAKRLLEVKAAYEVVSGEKAVPDAWTYETHEQFPLPVKRAIAETLRVFKQIEREEFVTTNVTYRDGRPYANRRYGRLPTKVMQHIFSFLAVGKPFGCVPPVQPRQQQGQSTEMYRNSYAMKEFEAAHKKHQLMAQSAAGWLHPPEPTVELFCLLLLLDVVKAPAVRNTHPTTYGNDYDVYSQGSDKIDNKLTIETFFNRMLAMSTTWQKRVFSYFMDIHENELAEAEAAGKNALAGVTEVGSGRHANAELHKEEQICVDRESGSAVMHLHIEVESQDSRLDCHDAWRKLKECGELAHHGGSHIVEQAVERASRGVAEGPRGSAPPGTVGAVCGFYEQKRSKRTILVVREERSTTYALWRPNSKKHPERRRLTYRALCERLMRFEALTDTAARGKWTHAWNRLDDRTTETYHLITGPVLACWHVIKDCAARVVNEVDHNAAPEGAVEKEENDKPDTTLSIVRAVLDDGRRIIGLQIEEGNVEYVVTELQRQHEIGWGEEAAQGMQPAMAAMQPAAAQGYQGLNSSNLNWAAAPQQSPQMVMQNQYGNQMAPLPASAAAGGAGGGGGYSYAAAAGANGGAYAAGGAGGGAVVPQQPTSYDLGTGTEW